MDFDVIAKLLAPVITAIVGYISKRYFEAKPKLISYLVHASAIPLHNQQNQANQQPIDVNTHSIVVRNSGKKTAHNVRIGHNFLPQSYQLYPQLTHQVIQGQNNSAEILIPTLVPNEQVNISYLYFPPVTWQSVNSYCKSDETTAKYVNVIPAPQLSFFQQATMWSLMFIGTSTIVYWLIMQLLNWVQ